MAQANGNVCKKYDVDCMNGVDYGKASLTDYVHLDEENHRILAQAIREKIENTKVNL